MSDYWTPKRNQNFREALDDAFDEASIDLLTSDYFGKSFARLSPAGFGKTSAYRLQEVINQAKMDDWLLDLVAAARERRPKNARVAAVAEDLGLTISGPRLINRTGSPLEALLNTNAKFIKPAAFREKLAQLEGQVCWIRLGQGGGTGFLVGSDLVLTNYHVMKPVMDKKVSWTDVVCQFDYREPIVGSPLAAKKLTEVKLHPDGWLMDQQPPSSFDWDPELGDAAPSEADYALVRLAEEIGDLPVGGATADTVVQKRGWICRNAVTPALVGGNLLFLLQHPKGEPLQLTVGMVTQFNAAGTRVRHDANSKDGSSGSPCFNADLELVALHHAHDPADPPKWNQAIPFGWIQKLWHDNAAVSALPGMKPCT